MRGLVDGGERDGCWRRKLGAGQGGSHRAGLLWGRVAGHLHAWSDPRAPPSGGRLEQIDEERNPFDPSCSEHVYWELLHELADKDGVQTQVVVDVISGTSAGGSTGCSSPRRRPQPVPTEPARPVVRRGGHRQAARWAAVAQPVRRQGQAGLVRAPCAAGTGSGGPAASWRPDVSAALRGAVGHDARVHVAGRRLRWVRPGELAARTGALELFVTMTDARGHRRYIPIGNRLVGGKPLVVSDLTHRHVARFALDRRRGEDHFAGGANDAALAFAARATSCFPGAFPPISLADFMREIGLPGSPDLGSIEREFFRAYQLARQGARTPISSTVGRWTTSRSSMPSGRSRAGRPPVRSSAGWSISNRTRAGRPASRAAPRRQRPRRRGSRAGSTHPGGLSSIPRRSRSSTTSRGSGRSTSGWPTSPT